MGNHIPTSKLEYNIDKNLMQSVFVYFKINIFNVVDY